VKLAKSTPNPLVSHRTWMETTGKPAFWRSALARNASCFIPSGHIHQK
jgi:hypothetical protein